MSTQVLAEILTSEVTCPICLELYTDPVRLECEHNFCRLCLAQHQQWREKADAERKPEFTCPQCLESFSPQTQPKSNRLLASIVERVRSMRLEPSAGPTYCTKHEERLKLYCESDEEPLCVVCSLSKDHKGHRVTPLQEATTSIKKALTQTLRKLESRRDRVLEVHQQQEQMAQEQETLTSSLKENIRLEYQKLQRFLQEEQEALLEKLQADEWQIRQEMEEKLRELEQETIVLEQEIQRVQESLSKEDATAWLKDIADLKGRWNKALPECAAVSRPLALGIYRGPLQYMVWKKMWNAIDPVPESLTFDPQSANSYIDLSEDRTSARYSYASQPCPENLEYFDFCACVLTSESFSSGRHYWEVDVGDRQDWDLGVAEDSASRDGWVIITPENGYWTYGHVACSTVGVFLDYEEGQLSFYDADNTKHLHTLKGSFTTKLYPFFFPSGDCNAKPMRLLHSSY